MQTIARDLLAYIGTSILCLTLYLGAANNQTQPIKEAILKRALSRSVLNCDLTPSPIIDELKEHELRICNDNPMITSLADDSFDVICALSSPSREPKENHTAMLKTYYDILRPDGILLIALKKGNNASTDYSEEEIKLILAEVGFEIIACKVTKETHAEQTEQFLEVLSQKK